MDSLDKVLKDVIKWCNENNAEFALLEKDGYIHTITRTEAEELLRGE